ADAVAPIPEPADAVAPIPEPADAVAPIPEPADAVAPIPEPAVPADPVTPVTLAEALAVPAAAESGQEPTSDLPSPDEVFTAADAPFTDGPDVEQVFTAAPATDAPPAEQIFTVAPAADAPEAPPADEVFTAEPPAGEALLARITDDTDPDDFTLPDPTEDDPAENGRAENDPAGTEHAEPPAGDSHAHAPAEADWLPRQGSHPADPAEGGGPVTDKGLPKRTPRTVAAPRREDLPPQPPRRVDAEELRRRLGGFYQGAQDGRRVVAAELAQDREPDRGQEQSNTDQGDSAQEART
ncbi:hypothetical protein ACFXAG_31035, partial [Streptomyces yangpuensis]